MPGVMLLFIALSWFCASHALAFDESLDEAPACDPIESQCEVRWGVVVESALGISREESPLNFRAAVRLNFPLTDIFEVRTDLVLGGFPGFLRPEPGPSYSSFAAGIRVDLQLNVGSVYTLGIGADVVLAFSGGLAGTHVSILGFRFGPKREFFVNLPQQLWINFDNFIVLEQLLSVSYLFDS
jgi:hypothetical protein